MNNISLYLGLVMASGGWQSIIEKAMFDINSQMLRPIYTWVRFRIRLAHFPKYKNNYNLKNGLAYCEIALQNRTCKQAFT